jgi:hypothetical protein
MLTSKKTTLKPLLESKDGIHLTAYLVNRSDIEDLKTQIRGILEEANEWLIHALSADRRKDFLDPLENLLFDSSILAQMKGNIGLFRNEDLFRIINIPIEIEPSCQVATSFHVKPLLRWLQTDQDFLILGLKPESIELFLGHHDSCKAIESIRIEGMSRKTKKTKKVRQEKVASLNAPDAYLQMSERIFELTRFSRPKLFMAGNAEQVKDFLGVLKYSAAVRPPLADSFARNNLPTLCQTVREILKLESQKALDRALLEFRIAEGNNRTQKNIFQIAKAVVQGRVRKLIVTDELSIFGRIDTKSGGLSIHPFDLDHEDDDLLDDLAQMVLSQGGEVIIAKRDEIPKGRPILAILDEDGPKFELKKNLDLRNVIHERFG